MLVKNFYNALGFGASDLGDLGLVPYGKDYKDCYVTLINPENKRIVQYNYGDSSETQKLVKSTWYNGVNNYTFPYQLTQRRKYENSPKVAATYSDFQSRTGVPIDITTDQITTDYTGGGGIVQVMEAVLLSLF